MGTYFLQKWNSQNKIFSWNFGKNLKHENKFQGLTDGFFKRFFFGEVLIVYKKNGLWFACFLEREFSIREIDDISFKNYGFFAELSIKIDHQSYVFFDLTLFDFFARKFDPTYDSFDEELIFGRWLLDIFENHRNRGQIY